jgi:hypothetical protein
MPTYLSTTGIRFNDSVFSEPTRLAEWVPPRFAGLFAVVVYDAHWAPRAFQPLFFGELANNTGRPLRYSDCARLVASAGSRTLLVSVLPMPFSTTAQRLVLRQELICAYNPACQIGGENTAASGDLVSRVDELEKQHREQTAQVLLLLTSINRMFEPQTVPARRRIGFLPESAPVPACVRPIESGS